MRLTKDNYELIMFDLLEGNIPEGNKASIEMQIEQDPFFKEEWELFQSTVLIPELNTVFEKKADLIKKETKVLAIPTWWSVGIAACVLFGLLYMLPRLTDSGDISDGIQPIASETVVEPTDILPIEDAESENSNEMEVQTLPPVNSPINPVFVSQSTPEEEPENIEMDYDDFRIESELRGRNTNNIVYNTNTLQLNDINQPLILISATDVTIGSVERITGKAMVTINKLRNPSLNVKPDWKQRQLDFELETQGYHAMASLTPFNK
ncbi:MAG: hypothetical protein JXR19_00405 [Bacteroidia bacterium]